MNIEHIKAQVSNFLKKEITCEFLKTSKKQIDEFSIVKTIFQDSLSIFSVQTFESSRIFSKHDFSIQFRDTYITSVNFEGVEFINTAKDSEYFYDKNAGFFNLDIFKSNSGRKSISITSQYTNETNDTNQSLAIRFSIYSEGEVINLIDLWFSFNEFNEITPVFLFLQCKPSNTKNFYSLKNS